MPDTLTAKLSLVKPEVGASADTWGNKTNGNWDIIDAKMVRNTIQWSVTPGDDNPLSVAGAWNLTRYGNDTLPIDNPISVNRQTGEVTVNKLKAITGDYSGTMNPLAVWPLSAAPAVPPASNVHIYVATNGHLVIQRPDGVIVYVGVPPGAITFTGAATPDAGWAFLDGSAIIRADNPVLFTRYGTLYGPGNGVTTFNLPDWRGRVPAHPDGAAGRLTNDINGFGVAAVLGVASGAQKHLLDVLQLAAHTHANTVGETPHSHAFNRPNIAGANNNGGGGGGPFAAMGSAMVGDNTGSAVAGVTINNVAAGGGQPHNNVQPTIIQNAQVRLG